MAKLYSAVALLAIGALIGCSHPHDGAGNTTSPKTTGPKIAIAVPAISVCPAKDFSSFLKAFAADKHLREQFTMPMVAVVDYVDPAGGGGDSDETKVIKVPRSEYRQFTLRYVNGGFHHASSDETIDPDVLDVEIKKKGTDYLVAYTYGMSEGNSWLFRYHDQCWYLAEDPEAPTE